MIHGVIIQTDILGREFCSVVEQVSRSTKKRKIGDRVVNSIVISCGECRFCKHKLVTARDKTNGFTAYMMLYGERMGGVFGYSHFTGGYAGGQAEYVRVPLGDQNLLELPDNAPFEKG